MVTQDPTPAAGDGLLGAAELRRLAARHGVRPAKRWGQHFVVDPNTLRRIAAAAEVGPDDVVVEVGPGLGSLTLALLARGCQVVALEIDPILAAALPDIVAEHAPTAAGRLTVVHADALDAPALPTAPTAFVANLPYNVSVPVVLTFLERYPSLRSGLVMVQLEVATRIAAQPGERDYGVPSAKVAWFAAASLVGTVPRGVFWPVPRVDSGLVALRRRPPPVTSATRSEVFTCIDAAFAQRRKTLRAALSDWAGGPAAAEAVLRSAWVDPGERGERLDVAAFAAIAAHRRLG